MFTILLASAIGLWFALLCPLALRHFAVPRPAENGPLLAPFLLVSVFAFMPLVFSVPRDDGSAVLQEGLTASNMVLVALTFVTALYLAVRIAIRPALARLPFAPAYLPFTLMIAYDVVSTAWSIVPTYTIYRDVELLVFTVATLMVFDRDDLEARLGRILLAFTVVWLIAVSPIIATSLASGIVFSSAKNNMTPLVCGALMLLAIFDPPARLRKTMLATGFAGFVIAGSAASTGALVAAIGPAMLIASPRPGRKILGWIGAAAMVAAFVVLMVGLGSFPVLVDILSAVLQKPAIELTNATGRTTFWPTFIAATRDHVFGSGHSAADRFLQLLIPTNALADELGKPVIFIASSHNMFLSAWAGTGVVGIGFAALVLGSAVRQGLRLDCSGRRFVVSVVLMLILNGMTTPGIFQDWTVNTFAFLAVVSYGRIRLLHRQAELRAPVRRLLEGARAAPRAWQTA